MYLLDTHVFLLALANPKRLSINARTILSRAEIDIYVSIATMWELATLQQTNKIVSNADFISEADRVGFHMLDIASSHLEIFKNLPAMSDPVDCPGQGRGIHLRHRKLAISGLRHRGFVGLGGFFP
jgi:PIN domain nuclease of toxin-antitoxin system